MRSLVFVALFSAAACDGRSDESMVVTGTEEAALTSPGGAPGCRAGKVLVCHIPPGNPANAHTICVGESAVQAHQRNHSDRLGACQAGGGDEAATPVID